MGALDTLFATAYADAANWQFLREDFNQLLDTGRWETVKDAGASVAVTGDTQFGSLSIQSAATTDNDGGLIQSLHEFVLPTSGKRILLEGSVKNSDADQTDLFFGLATVAATDPEAVLAVSNRVGFQIDDGNASILLKSEASDVETSKDSEIDLVDNVYSKLSMYYDGAGTWTFYVDDVKKNTITTNLPATEMGIALFHLSGSASGTRSSTWKRLHLAVEV